MPAARWNLRVFTSASSSMTAVSVERANARPLPPVPRLISASRWGFSCPFTSD
jgi:hypothetical protein